MKTGGARVWIRTRPETATKGRPSRVTLLHRGEGDAEARATDMPWDEQRLWHSAVVETRGKRVAYTIVAANDGGAERAFPLPAPKLTFAVPLLPPVKINEVLPRPGRQPDAPGEFVELFNPSEAAVDLEGYFLTDTRRNPTRWRIPKGNVVPPKGFIVFFADGLNVGNHTSFKLSNSGEYLGLYGRMEEGNLLVDSTAFRGVPMGESWGARPDGSKNFRVWKDPTPGARNIPKIPPEYLKGKEGAAGSGGPESEEVGVPEGARVEPPPGGASQGTPGEEAGDEKGPEPSDDDEEE